MFEVLTSRGILNSKSDLLQRHSPVIVRSQYVDARFLQSAEQAPLASRFVVVALPVVLAVPNRLVLQEFVRLQKNAQVVIRDRLVSSLRLGTSYRLLSRRLLNRRADIATPTHD